MTSTHAISLTINGEYRQLEVPANRLLVDLLRYDLGLTGTKESCSIGVCGACTIIVGGQMLSSCLALAVQYRKVVRLRSSGGLRLDLSFDREASAHRGKRERSCCYST